MYDQCIDQMVRAAFAKKRDEAVWIDKSGNIVGDETHAFGYKVTMASFTLIGALCVMR